MCIKRWCYDKCFYRLITTWLRSAYLFHHPSIPRVKLWSSVWSHHHQTSDQCQTPNSSICLRGLGLYFSALSECLAKDWTRSPFSLLHLSVSGLRGVRCVLPSSTLWFDWFHELQAWRMRAFKIFWLLWLTLTIQGKNVLFWVFFCLILSFKKIDETSR